MKKYLKLFLFIPIFCYGQLKEKTGLPKDPFQNLRPDLHTSYVSKIDQLTLLAATELSGLVQKKAYELNRVVSIAVVDLAGQIIVINRGDGVGPHNTEAARRKAFTAVSTKTATLLLAKNAKMNSSTENLAQLPELLLLGGGVPLYYNDKLIGAVGVAGGGSPENDDLIARAAQILSLNLIAR
ncbi:heme-binding protein [Pedobacter polysacchareus]|uniref:heme-binding protein n=1 Tax=Pedobacter polysacchareus TaxID=2861973 RepID=UPI001C99B555|nr:heme-binding protein [Pedobacter polysacchareus]